MKINQIIRNFNFNNILTKTAFLPFLYVVLFVIASLLPAANPDCNIIVKYSDRENIESRLYWEVDGEYRKEASQECIVKDGSAVYTLSGDILNNTQAFKFKVFEDRESVTVEGLNLECSGVTLLSLDGTDLKEYVTETEGVKEIQIQESCIKVVAAENDVYLFFGGSLLDRFQGKILLFLLLERIAVVAVVWFLAVIFIKKRAAVYKIWKAGEREKLLIRYWIAYFLTAVLAFATVLICTISEFLIKKFNGVSVEEIIFHLKVPLKGTSSSVIEEYLRQSYKQIFAFIIIFAILAGVLVSQKKIRNNVLISMGMLVGTIFAFVGSIGYFATHMNIGEYIERQLTASTFIEENYVKPTEANISFPDGKRNLIYIYLESMESTFASKEAGGAMDVNLIPELTELAENNINFSSNDLLGGATILEGTGWTISAMVAHSTGLPLLVPIDGNSYGEYSSFLPGAISIGEILEKEGYKQEIMVGSDIAFAGRDLFYEQHGNYQIWDYYTAIEKGKIPEDYYEWWGFEDEKLYSFAKEELLELASDNEPFSFTMLTADTHTTDGYLCKKCPRARESQYENTVLCASSQVCEFVKWLQQQDFYKDTVIVIVGDHLTMDNAYISKYYDGSAPRRVYNCFINVPKDQNYVKGRKFTTLDFFPTTLAAIGAEIEGDRLGLGTNLFSGEKTLSEIYGDDAINNELKRTSLFYRNHILTE